MDGTQADACIQENIGNVQTVQGLPECHDLSCMQEQDNDNIVKIYDIAKPPNKRKRDIPDVIQCSKLDSLDYVNCITQNGRNYGFYL